MIYVEEKILAFGWYFNLVVFYDIEYWRHEENISTKMIGYVM